MSVYFDDLAQWDDASPFFQRKELSHLTADTAEELHELAGRIGLRPKFVRERRGLPCYELTKSQREAARRAGATFMCDVEQVARRIGRGAPSLPRTAAPPTAPARERAACALCGEPAACAVSDPRVIGREGLEHACDACCQHRNEDGCAFVCIDCATTEGVNAWDDESGEAVRLCDACARRRAAGGV